MEPKNRQEEEEEEEEEGTPRGGGDGEVARSPTPPPPMVDLADDDDENEVEEENDEEEHRPHEDALAVEDPPATEEQESDQLATKEEQLDTVNSFAFVDVDDDEDEVEIKENAHLDVSAINATTTGGGSGAADISPADSTTEEAHPPQPPENSLEDSCSDGETSAALDSGRLPSDWAQQCVFQCPTCGDFRHTNQSVVSKHCASASESAGMGRQRSQVMCEEVVHRCCECGALIPWTPSILESHMKHNHKMTLASYAKTHRAIIAGQLRDNKRKKKRKDKAVKATSEAWYDKCAYECDVCGREDSDSVSMRAHCARSHGDKDSFSIVRETAYECKICGQEVLCQRGEIQRHLDRRHKMSIDIYSKLRHRKSAVVSLQRVDDHAAAVKPPQEQTKKAPIKTPAASIVEVAKKTLNTTQPGDTSWRDACEFKCNACGEVRSKRGPMVTHCRREHGSQGKTNDYTMSARVMHACLVCGTEQLNEAKVLTDHMHKSHKFNLATYEEKYYFPLLNRQAAVSTSTSAAPQNKTTSLASKKTLAAASPPASKRKEKKADGEGIIKAATTDPKPKIASVLQKETQEKSDKKLPAKESNTANKKASKRKLDFPPVDGTSEEPSTKFVKTCATDTSSPAPLKKEEQKKKQVPGPEKNPSKKPSGKTMVTSTPLVAAAERTLVEESDWREGCEFQCNSCEFTATRRDDIKRHCKRDHGNAGTTSCYEVSRQSIYCCLICKRSVLRESKRLNDHMHKAHRMNLVKYEREYGIARGTVPEENIVTAATAKKKKTPVAPKKTAAGEKKKVNADEVLSAPPAVKCLLCDTQLPALGVTEHVTDTHRVSMARYGNLKLAMEHFTRRNK